MIKIFFHPNFLMVWYDVLVVRLSIYKASHAMRF